MSAGSLTRSTWACLCLVGPLLVAHGALAAVLPAAGSQPGPSAPALDQLDSEQRLWAVLQPPVQAKKLLPEALVRQVVELGEGVVPAACRVLLGESAPPAVAHEVDRAAIDLRTEALFTALHGLPAGAVLHYVEQRFHAPVALPSRLVLWRIAGGITSKDGAPAILSGLDGLDPVQLSTESVQAHFAAALGSSLSRAPEGFKPFEQLILQEFPAQWIPCVARGLAASQRGEGLYALALLLGRSEDGDPIVLGAMASLAPLAWRGAPARALAQAKARLDRRHSTKTRCAAAKALTAMRADGLASELIPMLEEMDPLVVQTATNCLSKLSGRILSGPEAWTKWLAQEERWREEHAADTYGSLDMEEAGEVVVALAELVRHPLYANSSVDRIAPLLSRTEPALRRAALAAIQQLGSARPWRDVLELLVSPEDDEVQRAHATLQAVTGLRLPPARRAWVQALSWMGS
jgi:hypothetical protein